MGYRAISTEETPPFRSLEGAVVTAVFSPTRIILVKEDWRKDPRHKLPGGGIERKKDAARALSIQKMLKALGRPISYVEALVMAAALREVFEETGVWLCPEQLVLHRRHDRTRTAYRPYVCLARISEEQFDMHDEVTYEDHDPTKPTRVFEFRLADTLKMQQLLPEHYGLIRYVARAWQGRA